MAVSNGEHLNTEHDTAGLLVFTCLVSLIELVEIKRTKEPLSVHALHPFWICAIGYTVYPLLCMELQVNFFRCGF